MLVINTAHIIADFECNQKHISLNCIHLVSIVKPSRCISHLGTGKVDLKPLRYIDLSETIKPYGHGQYH